MYISSSSMHIATRRARLEAREAGFLVLYNTLVLPSLGGFGCTTAIVALEVIL